MAQALSGDDVRPTTVTLLIVLAAAVLALWFFGTHERVTREQWVGFQGEARANDHLAALMLLEELGIESKSEMTLTPTEWLPPVEDTLIVRLSQTLAIGDESIMLTDWVAQGGHLVLLPTWQVTQDEEDFLATLGFRLESSEYVARDEEEDEQAEQLADDDSYQFNLYPSYHQIIVDDEVADFEVVERAGEVVAARRQMENGYITLTGNERRFDNHNLNDPENARLFADLVAGRIEPGVVWIIYQSSFAPLWALILRSAPFLVLALAMLLILWMWRVMPVFGPRITAEQEARRSIIEHVRASGIFVWRHDGGEHMAASSTKALLHEAESRHPGISRQPARKQAEIIAQITGMAPQKVMDVLTGHGELRQREFTQSMRKLQTIRKEL